jgi:putative endonuclease
MAPRIDRPDDVAARPAARPERRAAFRLGLSAEGRAAALLMIKGYRIIARRWRGPIGEIDLIVRRRRLLVFVEVKARASLDEAAEAITPEQQRRIAIAAAAWLAGRPDTAHCDTRFDAVLVAPWRWPRHVRAAFDASE